ncbi:MAG: hypothetical protein ACFFDT_20445, partial [Candidatus Hodarchaeota archaeon]
LASSPNEFSTAYVRIDGKKLLESPETVIECLYRLYNLFIQGQVYEAMNQDKSDRRAAMLSEIKNSLIGILKGIGRFLEDRDIMFSYGLFKFELKRSGR